MSSAAKLFAQLGRQVAEAAAAIAELKLTRQHLALDRAAEIGVAKAAQELQLTTSVIYQWRRDLGRCNEHNGEAQRQLAVQRVLSLGIQAAAKELGVQAQTLRGWLRVEQPQMHEKMSKRRTYTDAEKLRICRRAEEIGVEKAAHEAGTVKSVVRRWLKKYPGGAV